jgi:hypothetical protein
MKLLRFPVYITLVAASIVSLAAQNLPEFQPALLGNHKKSLVNLLNAHSLMDRGQKDGMVMFEVVINEQGYGYNSRCYRGSANTDLLQKEVMDEIEQAQFEPAVYNHTRVVALMQGTVMFLIHDGKPMVRIFLNQEDAEIKAGHDFVAPQYCFATGNTAFRIFYMPLQPGGVGVIGLDVDARGKVTGRKVVYEYPPESKFGQIVAGRIGEATFIPGYRNGKPTACHFNLTATFRGPGKRAKTG